MTEKKLPVPSRRGKLRQHGRDNKQGALFVYPKVNSIQEHERSNAEAGDGLRNTVHIRITQESKSFVSECFPVYGVGSKVLK